MRILARQQVHQQLVEIVAAEQRFACEQCGALLTYQPGTAELVCAYCGHRNRIAEAPVAVAVRRRRGVLLFEVSDRGSGMSAETLRHVGEPFFTTKAPGAGMGLGVFLCRAVFESLGGQLGFVSTLGQGTRATVTLPLDGAVALYAPPKEKGPPLAHDPVCA